MRAFIVTLTLLLLLNACRAFERVDTVGTLEAEEIAFSTESALISTSSFIEHNNIASTAAAAESTMALIEGVNIQLIATLQRNITPTPALIESSIIDATQQADFEGSRLFIPTGLSSQINESDGCIITPQVNFSVDDPRIYATVKTFNIESGTPLSSRWYYEEELVYEFDFVTNQSWSEWCFYFYISPDIVEFRPGSWSVRLYADGFQLESARGFTMQASAGDVMQP